MAPAKRTRSSVSAKSGIIFPVARMHRNLKTVQRGSTRVTKAAAIYLAAVTEYLVAEVLELSGNAARDNQRSRIIPRHILLAVGTDEELNKLLKNCVIPQGGVLPAIHANLFPTKTGASPSQSSLVAASSTTTTTATTPKAPASKTRKPPLTKAGQGSFTVFSTPKPKAVALKGTAVTTLSERVLIRGQKLTVVQGSIIHIKADAVVHPTSSSFSFGGEVGHALSKAGGQQLRDAVAELAKTKTLAQTSDVAMCDAPNLAATHMIHVNSPTWNAASQAECIADLDKATINILTLADEKGLTSVAIPSISSGNAGFPKQTAAQTILAALSKYFRQTATTNLQQVFFVLYDAESVNVYTTELQRMVE